MTHDDVIARLVAADPLPDESLITDDDLALLASLVDEARSDGPPTPTHSAPVGATPRTARTKRPRWAARPVVVVAIAAAATIVAVGLTALLAPGGDIAPAGDPPVVTTTAPPEPTTPTTATTLPTTTTTIPTSTTATPIDEVVAGLVWDVQPFEDALASGVLGFDRAAYDGGFTEPGLWLFDRLQLPEPWPNDRFHEPPHDCGGGWNGEQILESPNRIVAICDASDWTPQRVRTWVWGNDDWTEVPTDPALWSGWFNGDDNRDGSLGPAGIFGAAIDIGFGFMANGTADFLWASEDGITWVPVPDTADAFPERSITRSIGTSNGLVYILGELDWPPDDVSGDLMDRLVVWIAELPERGGNE